jgi:N utilization substance protein B
MAIIACAMAEIEHFPEIPQNVTLNEYIEISKFYCSPKSRSFINGLLDRFVKENNKTE